MFFYPPIVTRTEIRFNNTTGATPGMHLLYSAYERVQRLVQNGEYDAGGGEGVSTVAGSVTMGEVTRACDELRN